MKFTFILNSAFFFLCLPTITSASWVWADWVPDLGGNPSGTSGSFTFTPLYADYDNGDGSPGFYDAADGIINDGDLRGWDRTPQDFTATWSVTGNEFIEFDQVSPTAGGFSHIEVLLDPDGNDILPTSVTYTMTFPFDLVTRGIPGGALGATVNPIDMTLDAHLTSYYSNGTQVNLDNTFSYSTNGGTQPNSFSSGSAFWDGITNFGGYHGLDTDGANPTLFPFVNGTTVPDRGQAIGAMTWVFSDFKDGEVFRISFDGGVPALARAPIPEPSATLLIALGGLVVLRRRR